MWKILSRCGKFYPSFIVACEDGAMRPISLVAMAVGLAQQPLAAQPRDSTPTFDVASIRQHTAAITEVASWFRVRE